MSDSPARSVSTPRRSPQQEESSNPRLDAGAQRALDLCRTAASQGARLEEAGGELDALESLLPTLGQSSLEALLDDPGYRAVRSALIAACADAWFTRECRLARRALAGPASSTLRSLFGEHIPREAYADELAVLESLEPRRILVIGSGPCPMSAIVFQDAFPAAVIVGMDRAPEACELSAGLLSASGYSMVEVRQGDAAGAADLAGFDCVLMALTVGEDEAEKASIIRTIRDRADPDAVLVVRTAVGWGRVLYPSVDIPEILAGAARRTVRTSHQRSVAVPIRMADLPA